MQSRLAKRLHAADEARGVCQGPQFNTGYAGRLDHSRQRELEIVLRSHTRIVHRTRDNPYLYFLGVWRIVEKSKPSQNRELSGGRVAAGAVLRYPPCGE
jgi:hypothetical protein